MYSLEQTKDLANISAVKFPLLSRFLDFMCNEVRNWLSSMSGIELDEKVGIFYYDLITTRFKGRHNG